LNRALVTGFWWPAIALCVVTGCVVEAGPATTGIAVSGPPPQPVREVPPPAPNNVQAVWVPGYWHWTGLQYTWIPGHWERAPPGASWRAPHYSIREGTYFYEPGGWAPR
jgi:hypothetical protein